MKHSSDFRLESARRFYAKIVSAGGAGMRERLEEAFATIPREHFLGPGPWWARAPVANSYIATPDTDPIHVYQDLLFALDRAKGINNGEPALHGSMLGALDPDRGDTVLHIGCGTGYYSAILAELVGPGGRVVAYEIEPAIAQRARHCLEPWRNVEVICGSGAAAALPTANRIYVNAGASRPVDAWLDALAQNGRLVFPLSGGGDSRWGVTVALTRRGDAFAARIVGRSGFIGCAGAYSEAEAAKVSQAFQGGAIFSARSLHRGSQPGPDAILAGEGWWLSPHPCEP